MRIKITLSADKQGIIDFNYQHQIQAVIYSFLSGSDPDYASWLHEQGFVYKNDKRFKFFVFSGIIFHGPIKINSSNRSNSLNSLSGLSGFSFTGSANNPFTLSFQIASPIDKFIQHLVNGIFKKGSEIRLGSQLLTVYRVETLPVPLEDIGSSSSNGLNDSNGLSGLSGLNGLNCLSGLLLKPLESPIFIKKPMPEGERDIYLFPDDKDYEELLNQNLIHKYETLFGEPYKGKSLKFDFKQFERLEQFKRFKPIKSFKIFKNGKITGEIKGTLLPFKATGPMELVRIGLDCGFGQSNSMGCGYVEAVGDVQ